MKTNRKIIFRRKLVAVAVASCFTITPVFANPIGATVVNGQVGFATQGSTLTVTNSPNSIINWQQFSINTGETTRFIQQSVQSAVLNRVVGQDPSQLLGSLLSNGRVYLINPNGILFGQGAVIDVGGLVASTLKLSDGDFLAGRLNFTGGAGAGGINNQGSITTPAGGNVYLIAPDITNSGVITSPQGEILLAAGHTVNLMDTTTPNVQVTVGAPDTQAVNLGALIARSGKAGIYGALIDQQGLVNADTAVVGANGRITLRASKDITLEPGSVTTASGMAGGVKDGGEIRIVADGTLNVRQGSEVHVDGGVDGGNGGFLELSGRQKIALNGAYTGAAKAAGYHGGTLLLDPTNITICSDALSCGTASPSIATLGGGTINAGSGSSTLYLSPNMAGSGGWTDVQLAATNNISVNSALANSDVPAGGSLTLAGGIDVNINTAIGSSETRFDHDLTLIAGNNVNVNGDIYLGNKAVSAPANLSMQADASYTGLGLTLTPNGFGNVVIMPAASGTARTVDVLGDINVSGVNLNIITGSNSPITVTAGNDFIADLTGAMTIQAANISAYNGQALDSTVTLHAGNDIIVNAATGITIAAGNATANASVYNTGGSFTNSASAIADANVSAGRDISLITSSGSLNVNGGNATAAAFVLARNISSQSIAAHNTATAHAAASVSAGGDMTLEVTNSGAINVSGGSAVAWPSNGVGASSDSTAQNNTITATNTATATTGASLTAGGRQALTITYGDINVNGGTAVANASNWVGASSYAWANSNTITATNTATATAGVSLTADGQQTLTITSGTLNINGGSAVAQAPNWVGASSSGAANNNNIAATNTAVATAGVSLTATGDQMLTVTSGNINIWGGDAKVLAGNFIGASSASANSNTIAGSNNATATAASVLSAAGAQRLSITDAVTNGNINIYAGQANAGSSSTGMIRFGAVNGVLARGSNGIASNNSIGTGSAAADNTATATATLDLSGGDYLTISTASGNISIGGSGGAVTAYGMQGVYASSGSAVGNSIRGNNTATATGHLNISAGGTGTGDLSITAGGGGLNDINIQGNPASGLALQGVNGGSNTLSGDMNATATNGLTISSSRNITLSASRSVNISNGHAAGSAYQAASGSSNGVSGSHTATATNGLTIAATGNMGVTAGSGYSGGSVNINGNYANGRARQSASGSYNTLGGDMSGAATNGLTLSGNDINLAAANSINISGSYASDLAYQEVTSGSYQSVTGNHDATATNGLTIAAAGDLGISAGSGGSGSLNINGNYANGQAYRNVSGNYNALGGDMSGAATNGIALSGNNITLAAANNINISGNLASGLAYQDINSGSYQNVTGNHTVTATNGLTIAATGDLGITAGSGGSGSLNINGNYAQNYAQGQAFQREIVFGIYNALGGDMNGTGINGLVLSGNNITLSAANNINIGGSLASGLALAYQDVNGNYLSVAGSHTATATNSLSITATGNLDITASGNGGSSHLRILGGNVSANAFQNVYGGGSSEGYQVVTGSHSASVTNGLTLGGANITLSANNNISISGGYAHGNARQNVNGNYNSASGSHTAIATNSLSIAATGNLDIAAGTGNSAGDLNIRGGSAGGYARQDASGYNNTLSGDMSATETNGIALSGANITLAAANNLGIGGGSFVYGYAYQNVNNSGNSVSGSHTAIAASSLGIAATGDLGISAGSGDSGGSLTIRGGNAYVEVRKAAYSSGDSNTLSGGQDASATNTVSLSGKNITLTGNSGVGIYADWASANAYKSVDGGEGNNLSGNQSAAATSALTIAATDGDLSVTAVTGSLYISGSSADANAYKTASGSAYFYSNTLSDNETATATSALNLTASGGITLAATTGGVSISASSASAYARQNVYGNNHDLSGDQAATATVTLNIAAGGDLSITAGGGSLDINASSADASAYQYVGGGNNNALSGNQTATATNTLSLSGKNVTLSGNSGVGIYASSASASAYKYVGSGSGNNLSGNQGATATSALTIAATGGNLSVTAATGSLYISGSSALAAAYKTTYGNSDTLSGNETAAATSTLNLTSTGGITLAATTGGVNINASSAIADAYQSAYGSSHTLSGNHAATAVATLNIAAGGGLGITAGSGNLNIYGDNAEGYAYQYVSGSSNILSGAMTANAASNINLSGSTIAVAASGGITVNGASVDWARAYSVNSGSGNALSGTRSANANAGITLSGNLTASSGSVSLNGGYADASGAGAVASANVTLNADMVNVVAGDLNLYGGSAYAIGSGAVANANVTLNTNSVNVVAGDLNLYGGSAYAIGSGAVAHADAQIISTGDLNIDAAGNVYLQGGNVEGYPGATAGAVAFIGGYPQTVTITTGNDFTLYGSLPSGNGGTEYGYAGIVGLQAMTINVGNDFNLAGGTGTAYTDALWGGIGPGTGKWDTPFSPIILNVGGAVNNIDNITCPTCAPAFLQLLMSALPPAVLYAVDLVANTTNNANSAYADFIEPIHFGEEHEDKKNEKPVCR